MSTTASSADLCARIESLVQEHIAASHKLAMATLQRAFSSTLSGPGRRQRTRSTAPHRSQEMLAALQDAIYECLKASPGLGAAELASQLGIESKALSGPVAKLKKAGLVRRVGQRAAARYFPIAEDALSTA